MRLLHPLPFFNLLYNIYMPAYPSPEALVLVAIIPSRRDLEIARLLGWYRIPLRRAPKVINVDFLAFYQVGDFGPEHRWQIEQFAEVRGHELTTRRELFRDQPDHPRAGDSEKRKVFFYFFGASHQKN